MADSKTYHDITPAAMELLRRTLERFVELPPGNAGHIESHGVSGDFAYDPGAQSLTLTVHRYPMLAPKAMLWGAVEKAITEAKRR